MSSIKKFDIPTILRYNIIKQCSICDLFNFLLDKERGIML